MTPGRDAGAAGRDATGEGKDTDGKGEDSYKRAGWPTDRGRSGLEVVRIPGASHFWVVR